MQAAVGNVVCTSPLCRSDAYRFSPLPSAGLEGRRLQSVSGQQRSQGFKLGPWRCRSRVVRPCQSSDCVEKVDFGIHTIKASANSASTRNVGKGLALLGSGGITFCTAGGVAQENVVDASGQGGEVTADTGLSTLFTAAFIGLSMLTIGVAGPALAEAVPVEMVDDSQYWWEVLLTSGACGIIYLLVIPAIIYNYLRLRWYKRNALETYFQFMLVFIFFPGLLLLAPFINFRRLPKEGTEAP
ncbi:NAD(P)H-quinone oxidoreductase subunit L [Marchantia polymorpha subsp. ruderalis]|uniref:NDH subunit NdhL n=2 Tax=Marchantia polymorpha TaxID=3197 RepID=A0A176VPC8_MARPO|nr:hypothetical protein AXG93_2035s1380 [Marchantia polymorpha subsp. ruderalis]PTQ49326.1 hypothetical protein MARPO_0003s0200 [Marchantia polymorpha]BBN17091.1 hypothetical protein Mp_7g11890 [Marchantia polymorpha subsp. ruderalis]CCI55380.1 NDH subunit NdhL [Marchantia polymorpha]|eukprot:PTQ49326.1 hypothetical protein MARPO_0003s0200 [Marchantia polymorpha]